MASVLGGFAVVFAVIAVGYLLGRTGVLGAGAGRSMGLFVYYVATPALLFDRVTHSTVGELFSKNLLITGLSTLFVGLSFAALSYLVLRRSRADSLIGMLAASYANAGNLGIPLAAYVLGDAAAAIPLILFQVAFYAPVTMTALEMASSTSSSLVRNLVLSPMKNTMVLSAIAGLLVLFTGVQLPTLVEQPVTLLAGAAVPVALVVFGMGLSGTRVLQKEKVARRDVWLAVLFKNLLHPLVALGIGSAFGLHGHDLLIVVVMAALPTAQNVYTYALRFRTAETLARDAGVVSTLVSFPVLVAISVLLL